MRALLNLWYEKFGKKVILSLFSFWNFINICFCGYAKISKHETRSKIAHIHHQSETHLYVVLRTVIMFNTITYNFILNSLVHKHSLLYNLKSLLYTVLYTISRSVSNFVKIFLCLVGFLFTQIEILLKIQRRMVNWSST